MGEHNNLLLLQAILDLVHVSLTLVSRVFIVFVYLDLCITGSMYVRNLVFILK